MAYVEHPYLGHCKVYEAGVTPLSEAIVWPADMSDDDAECYAEMIEAKGAALIGAIQCGTPHGLDRCAECGAAL